nr:unnamed protein product [Callosobruchus analis]
MLLMTNLVPLHNPFLVFKILSSITIVPTFNLSRCWGIPDGLMLLKNSMGTVVISLAILGVSAAQFIPSSPLVYPYGQTPFLSQHYKNADHYKNLLPYYRSTDYYKNFPQYYQNTDYYENLTHNLPPHLRHHDFYNNFLQNYENADYYRSLPQYYQKADHYKNFPDYNQNEDKYHNIPSHLRPADYYKNLPQYYKDHQYYRTAESVAPIVRYDSDVQEDGSYEYSYETGNGIAAQESGVQRPVPPVGELVLPSKVPTPTPPQKEYPFPFRTWRTKTVSGLLEMCCQHHLPYHLRYRDP